MSKKYLLSPVLILLLLAACSSDDSSSNDVEPTVEPTLSAIQAEIFDPQCTMAGTCHGANANQGELILEAGFSHEEMVGVDPETPAAASDGLQLVAPGDPESSFLVIKVRGPDMTSYGTVMPQGTSGLEPGKIAAIEEWIRQGAPDN